MKDILVLLVLLSAQTIKICSLPYEAGSGGNCQSTSTEYLVEESNLCCKKCPPGQRVKQKCSETTDTECEDCPAGTFMEGRNYSPNCLTCTTCRSDRGLQEAQKCSPTTRSKCACQPGWFCMMGFDKPYCGACRRYTRCKVGHGVSVPGKANSDVKCERCPNGMFSDTISTTDRCRPHTKCHGGAVVKQGNATADTVCDPSVHPESPTVDPPAEKVSTTARPVPGTTEPDAQTDAADTTPPISQPVSEAESNPSTAVVCVVVVLISLFIVIILLCLRKRICKKDAARFHPKVDANGNCETRDKINQGYLGETKRTSFTVIAREQQCLLENGEACSEQSQGSNNNETSTRTDGCQSFESIGPFQSTKAHNYPNSLLSEPRTLISNQESVSSQTSVPMQSPSQPASPPIIGPVTANPHVNVNITVHIGNGNGGSPAVMPADLTQTGLKLPFGEEEESFSIPQQEDGKPSLISVQDSESYSD